MSATFALVLRPDASFKIVEFSGNSPTDISTIYSEIDSPNIAVMDLSPKISVWLDDDGNNGSELNRPAIAIHAATILVSHEYYGTTVYTGTDPKNRTTGLTLDNCAALLELAGIDTPTVPHPRTA
ncbi:hypothetical protein GCM10010330_77440 [Streptomyces tendae]|uniref:DUF3846 domain-containing protein n=1 Tax=Streptomyces tendae TaxID=1932 RepID=UPI001676C551|nr:DUF3846 domain-containing protein [Streptomyces tendae]GHB11914.1 hypothetical protein GCM10010330_77440 [Streptomyces tendae]